MMNKRGAETGQLGLCAVIAAVAIVAIVGLVIFFGRSGGVLAVGANACDQLASLKAMFCPDRPACAGVTNAWENSGCGSRCFNMYDWAGTGDPTGAVNDCFAKTEGNVCGGGPIPCANIATAEMCYNCIYGITEPGWDMCQVCQDRLDDYECPGICLAPAA